MHRFGRKLLTANSAASTSKRDDKFSSALLSPPQNTLKQDVPFSSSMPKSPGLGNPNFKEKIEKLK